MDCQDIPIKFDYDDTHDIMYITFKLDKCFDEEPIEGIVLRFNRQDELCGLTILDWDKREIDTDINKVISYCQRQIELYLEVISKIKLLKYIKGVDK